VSWILAYQFRASEATSVATGSEVGPDGLAVNVKTMRGCSLYRSWRTAAVIGGSVALDFAADLVPEVVFAPGANMRDPSVPVSTILFNGSDIASIEPTVSFPATYNAAANVWLAMPTGSRSRDRWSMIFVETGTPREHRFPFFGISTSTVEINDYYRPEKDWEILDPSFISSNGLGGRHVNEQRIFRKMKIRFGPMPWDSPDGIALRAFVRAVGTHAPFLVILDEENLDIDGNVIFGCLQRMPRFRGSPGRMMRGDLQILSIEN